MFITIPLFLIVGSLIAIVAISYRKVPYLKKLTPESHELGSNIVHDFFPELMSWFGSMNLHNYKQSSLMEIEKVLRRLRVVSLKIDHLSDSLIKKIRHSHVSNHLEQAVLAPTPKPQEIEEVKLKTEPSVEDLKSEEQRLIIEIAKNPKDPQLYETLGDLYLKINSAPDAKESYEAALELNPHDIPLAKKYSRLIQKLGVAA